jgi:hypothetical protein
MEHVSLISWDRFCPSWNPALPIWTDLNPDVTHGEITARNTFKAGANRKRNHEKLGCAALFKGYKTTTSCFMRTQKLLLNNCGK